MKLSAIITRFVELFYVGPLRRWFVPSVFRYLACGAINMALDAVWYFVIYHFVICERYTDLGFVVISPHILALCIVFPITFLTGFWLNRNVAFRAVHVGSGRQLVRYLITVMGSIVLNYVCMKGLVEYCLVWPTISKILTTLICAVYSYLVGRYYTFSE